jgi:hypothetical protein
MFIFKQFYSFLLSIALLLPFTVFSNDTEGCKFSNKSSQCLLFSASGFLFDNDLFDRFVNDDRNYSYGVFWNWNNKLARNHVFHTETIQQFILDDLFRRTDWKTEYAFQFGISNFTPDNLVNDKIEYQDRPYSNLLFVHSDVYKISPSYDVSIGAATTFGVIGTSIGGAIQSGWHSLLREISNDTEPVNPNGWHNQVSDGGELTARVAVSYNKKIKLSKRTDLAWSVDSSLGFYTYASAGAVFRFGTLSDNALPHEIVKLSSPVAATIKAFNEDVREQFFFAGIRQVHIGYNVLLQCQFKDSAFCLENNQIERNITEWSFGFKTPFFKFLDIGEHTNLTFSWHGRTAEHKLDKARNHHWGGLTFEWIH